MTNFTCFHCTHCDAIKPNQQSAYCYYKERCVDAPDMICPDFLTKDEKQPRFCRLASSIDDMADALICEDFDYVRDEPCYRFFADRFSVYSTKEEAIAAAKAWLCEVKSIDFLKETEK